MKHNVYEDSELTNILPHKYINQTDIHIQPFPRNHAKNENKKFRHPIHHHQASLIHYRKTINWLMKGLPHA